MYTLTVTLTCLYFLLHTLTQKEENARRAKEGEELLPEDDKSIEKELNVKPTHAPPRQQALLTAEQVESQCEEIIDVSGQAFSKLYLSQMLNQQ